MSALAGTPLIEIVPVTRPLVPGCGRQIDAADDVVAGDRVALGEGQRVAMIVAIVGVRGRGDEQRQPEGVRRPRSSTIGVALRAAA